jgi:hypothetical protein
MAPVMELGLTKREDLFGKGYSFTFLASSHHLR